MFSDSNKDTALRLFANVEEIAAFLHRYEQAEQLSCDDQAELRNVIKSLDEAIHPKSSGHKAATFLTAKALSIKIFLQTVLYRSTKEGNDLNGTADQLMEILQEPEDQVSPLTLCVTLGAVFWQTMMGAIAASNGLTRSFYISRLRRIVVPLALKSWNDALSVLQRFLWTSSIFSGPCRLVFSEITLPQSYESSNGACNLGLKHSSHLAPSDPH